MRWKKNKEFKKGGRIKNIRPNELTSSDYFDYLDRLKLNPDKHGIKRWKM